MKTSQLPLPGVIIIALHFLLLSSCTPDAPSDQAESLKILTGGPVAAVTDTLNPIIYDRDGCTNAEQSCYNIRCNFPLLVLTQNLFTETSPSLAPTSVEFEVHFRNLPGEIPESGTIPSKSTFCPFDGTPPGRLRQIDFEGPVFSPTQRDSIPNYKITYQLQFDQQKAPTDLGGGICIILETMDPKMSSPSYEIKLKQLLIDSEGTLIFHPLECTLFPVGCSSCPDSTCFLPQ